MCLQNFEVNKSNDEAENPYYNVKCEYTKNSRNLFDENEKYVILFKVRKEL